MPSVSGRSHRDSKMANILNYGSEEESDKEEEGITQPLGAPRMARMLMDEEDEEVERGNQLLTHRKFRKALIIDLLSAHGTRISISKTITKLHTPAQYDLIKSGKTDRLKRKCAVCGKRTITYCKACNVAMCLFTCYEPYHNSH
uniref:Uncharacterized protein n=1 Tax=Bombyx mori TaxID=7091 RepID=H9J443_BOMMO|nr:hypothetical protein [Bombyx mori]